MKKSKKLELKKLQVAKLNKVYSIIGGTDMDDTQINDTETSDPLNPKKPGCLRTSEEQASVDNICI